MNFLQQNNSSFLLVPNQRVLKRDSPFYDQIMRKMSQLWGVGNNPLKFNPCANPISLERHHLVDLVHKDYVVAEKSDGVRYALALLELQQFNGAPFYMGVMVNRNLDVFEVRVTAPLYDFQKGCIFDGELVWDETNTPLGQRHAFYVFDTIAYQGQCVRHLPFWDRYRIIRKKFIESTHFESKLLTSDSSVINDRITTQGSAHRLTFCCKTFYMMNQFDIASKRTILHSSDGFIFIPMSEGMPTNRASNWFKWKKTHNIDVIGCATWITDGWRVCMLYLDGEILHDASRIETSTLRHPKDNGIICLRLIDGNSALGAPIPNINELRNVWELSCHKIERTDECWIAECRLHAVRWDKPTPNNALTIERSLASASDPVRLEELLAVGVDSSRIPSGQF